MSSLSRKPERRTAPMRFVPIALWPVVLVALLAVVANDARAQQAAPQDPPQNALPDAHRGPKSVSVSGLFPNGATRPPPDPIGTQFEGNKLAIAAGKVLFGQMNCSGCHFNGGGGMGPALMSGHWRYGGHMDQIYESIAQGRPNGMPSWQFTLQPAQIWELAAYVKSLAVPAPSSASQAAVPGSSVKQ